MQNGRSVEIYTHCVHVFVRLAPICMLSRCLFTKFLHRSSVGSLSRVRCWLGFLTQAFCVCVCVCVPGVVVTFKPISAVFPPSPFLPHHADQPDPSPHPGPAAGLPSVRAVRRRVVDLLHRAPGGGAR